MHEEIDGGTTADFWKIFHPRTFISNPPILRNFRNFDRKIGQKWRFWPNFSKISASGGHFNNLFSQKLGSGSLNIMELIKYNRKSNHMCCIGVKKFGSTRNLPPPRLFPTPPFQANYENLPPQVVYSPPVYFRLQSTMLWFTNLWAV